MIVKIPIRLLKIEGDGFHLQMTIKINGKTANAILDTGASKSVFDKEQIANFLNKELIADHERLSTGLGTTSMQSHQVTLEKLSLGKIEIYEYNSVVLNLRHVNHTYEHLGLKRIDGVIGSDLLEKYKAVIDYGKRVLILKTKESKSKKKKSSVKKTKKKVAKKK